MNWKILFVDDEVSVVDVARLTLQSMKYRGLGIEVLWANSAEQARNLLSTDEDIAVAFVDVLLGPHGNGLDLIKYVRSESIAWRTRLILLTGQTLLAPEASSTVRYDLDGYLDKATLTNERLFAATYSALRSFDMITRLNSSRQAILQAVTTLSQLDTDDSTTRSLKSVISELIGVGDTLEVDAAWAWQSAEGQ